MVRISVLIVLAAFLGYASYPGLGIPVAAWLMYVPFYFSLEKRTPPEAALLGTIMALVSWSLVIWWFVPGMIQIGEVAWWIAIPIYLFQCLVAAIPYGIYGYLQARYRVFSPSEHPVLSSALFTLLLSYFPGVFPGTLAHSQYQYPELIQICALGGAGALLFCITLTSVFLFLSLKRFLAQSHVVAVRFLVLALLIPFSLYCYGQSIISRITAEDASLTPLRLVLIQPDIPVSSDRSDKGTYLDRITKQTRQAVSGADRPDLVVWPELPLSFSIVNQPRDYHVIASLLSEVDTPLLLSAFLYESGANERDISFYNVVHLVQDSPDNARTYRKNILIPFGEYLPFSDALPFLKEVLPDVRQYTAGKVRGVLPLNDSVRIAPVVCLEAIFPDFVHEFVEQGANVIINPADDAYFGDTPGAAVHMALAAFRSVENRIPFVRVNNSGLTQVYDHLGRELLANPELFSQQSYNLQVGVPAFGQQSGVHSRFFFVLLAILVLGVLVRRFSVVRPLK